MLSQPASSLEAPIAWTNQPEGVNSDAEKRCSSPAVLGDSAVAVVDQDGAATEESSQARRDASARENAIRQLEKHGIDYSLELTDERKRELKPLPAIIKDGQKRRCESGYVGVSRGRKDRWQAQVDHRAIGGFATAYEAGVAVTLRMIELAQGKKPPPIQSSKNRMSGKAGQQVEPLGGPPRKKWKSTPQGSPSVFFNMSPSMVEPWDAGHSDPASATSTSLGKMRKPTATIHPSLRNEGNNPAALPLAPATITMAPINLGSFYAGAAHHHGWTLLPASNVQQSSTHIAATQHAVPAMGGMISSSYIQLLNENTRAQQAYLLAARTQLASTYEALAKCRNELDASRKAMEMLVTQTQQEPDMPSLAPSSFPALPEIPELPPLPAISELPAGLSIVEPAVLFTAPNLSSITPHLVPTSTQSSSEALQPASNYPAPEASSSRTAPEVPVQEVVINTPTSPSFEATATRPLATAASSTSDVVGSMIGDASFHGPLAPTCNMLTWTFVGSLPGPSAHQPCTNAPSTSEGELSPPLAAEQLAFQIQQAIAQRQQLELYQLQLQEQVAQNHRIMNALQQQRLSAGNPTIDQTDDRTAAENPGTEAQSTKPL